MKPEEILELARAAYAAGVKPTQFGLGVSVLDGAFAPMNTGCCGLGAALTRLPVTNESEIVTTQEAVDALGLTPGEAGAFVSGFDGYGSDGGVDLSHRESWFVDYYDAGRKLAKEVLSKQLDKRER